MTRTILAAIAAALATSLPTAAQDRLETVFSSDLIVNGATTSPNGRLFLPVQPAGPGASPELVEIREGKPVAYPDERWNAWKPGLGAHDRFVGVNSIRVGPDGALWVVDRGAPGIGLPPVPGGPKLVKIDLAANQVVRVYDLGANPCSTSRASAPSPTRASHTCG